MVLASGTTYSGQHEPKSTSSSGAEMQATSVGCGLALPGHSPALLQPHGKLAGMQATSLFGVFRLQKVQVGVPLVADHLTTTEHMNENRAVNHHLHPHQQQCITIPKCQNICILPARAPKCMQIVPSLPHFQNDQPTTAQTATPSLPEAVCLTFAHLATRKATDGDNHGVARRTTQVTAGFVLALAAFANRIRGPMALPLLSMPNVCPNTICGL
jgi:hypothetical protein